jgi:hypothetical protein
MTLEVVMLGIYLPRCLTIVMGMETWTTNQGVRKPMWKMSDFQACQDCAFYLLVGL